MAQVNGMLVVLRTGISGELGYELHGSADDVNEIWSAVATAGAEFGSTSRCCDGRFQRPPRSSSP